MRPIDADALTEKYGDWYVEEGPEEGFIGTLGQLLSVQPETNCSEIPNNSDTISRQQAIDELHGKDPSQIWDTADIEVWLNTLPSIQPERKKGEWIHQPKFSRVECDQCGKVFRNTFTPKNFCPNCGAKMEGGEQE